ncbi:MAG: hypothetical protein GY854_11485 [Deltaproteobacteria bacterium]|nr:hypothetical protein [Deltaproteobacteria bacterium]
MKVEENTSLDYKRDVKSEGKAKESLAAELEAAHQRIAGLEEVELAGKKAEEQLRQLSRHLEERVKELNCLYEISRLRDDPAASLDDLLQGIVDLIPAAWSYPEITCARLILGDREFKTDNFRKTQWKQICDINVNGEKEGNLQVYYIEERPIVNEGPFLLEEKKLLDAIAKNIEEIIARKHAENQTKLQQQQLIQLDKLAAMGTLISGVAHEINNPNNFVMLNTPLLEEVFESALPILDTYYTQNGDFLLGGLQYSEMREKVPLLFSGILEGSKRIKSIVNGLKDFARIEVPDQKQLVNINEIIISALRLIDNLIRKSTKNPSVAYGKELPELHGSFQRLEQVIVNLVQNACESLQDREREIYISTRYAPEARSVVVTVSDEGVGIPTDTLPRIMDPFFTTKRQMSGTGLGLSVSSGIVKDHGGELSFESELGKGTKATLTLPVAYTGTSSKWP